MNWKKAAKLLLAAAVGGIPLITTATCDPYRGSVNIYRDDDYGDHWYDVFVDDCYYWDDCYYYDEVIIWD